MRSRYFMRERRALAAVLAAGLILAGREESSTQQQVSAQASTFIVFLRGARIGSEDIALTRNADGWTIASAGRFGPPLDIVIRDLQARYTSDWKPIELKIDAIARDQPLLLRTTIADTTATTTFTQAGESGERTDTISPEALLLPSPFWGPFEALAQRLRTAAAGTVLQSYMGLAAVPIEVGNSTEELIQT